MQKRIVSLILLMVMLLSACSSNANAPANTEAENDNTTESQPVDSASAASETSAVAEATCTVSSLFGDDEDYIPVPEVNDTDWIIGNPDAPVTILEYSDIQCPYCSLLEPVLIEYVNQNPDKVRLVFRHFPLPGHQHAGSAAVMIQAAGQQGVEYFEAMKAELFATQSEWANLDDTAFIEYGTQIADDLGLDVVQFSLDMNDEKVLNAIEDDYKEAVNAGVSYTPFVMVNNLIYQANITTLTVDDIDAMVDGVTEILNSEDGELLASMPRFTVHDTATLEATIDYYKELIAEYDQEYLDSLPYYFFDSTQTTPQYIQLYNILNDTVLDRQFDSCPEQVIDPDKSYKAILKTEFGDVTISLNQDVAPFTVNSFVFLAENGWYDDITFHRVIPDFVAQTGDPSGTGIGTPGYLYTNEITPDYLFDQAGRVGMANQGNGTNGAQFFITYSPQPNLNGSYTVFGQVEEGMDVLEKLQARNASAVDDAEPGSKLISVEIIEE
jgi:cyclophilin family peptidyl-prolyl cis-trans isomerase/protein-disulfide isomerase